MPVPCLRIRQAHGARPNTGVHLGGRPGSMRLGVGQAPTSFRAFRYSLLGRQSVPPSPDFRVVRNLVERGDCIAACFFGRNTGGFQPARQLVRQFDTDGGGRT